jgi:hypothetical protein
MVCPWLRPLHHQLPVKLLIRNVSPSKIVELFVFSLSTSKAGLKIVPVIFLISYLLVTKIEIWTKIPKSSHSIYSEAMQFSHFIFFLQSFSRVNSPKLQLDVCIRLPRIASHKIMKQTRILCRSLENFSVGIWQPYNRWRKINKSQIPGEWTRFFAMMVLVEARTTDTRRLNP